MRRMNPGYLVMILLQATILPIVLVASSASSRHWLAGASTWVPVTEGFSAWTPVRTMPTAGSCGAGTPSIIAGHRKAGPWHGSAMKNGCRAARKELRRA